LLTLLTLVTLLTACAGPGYYLQAVSGQWKLLRARRDVDTLLADSSTPPALVQQLTTAEQILTFAKTELDLPSGKSYSTYVDIGRDTLVWNVIATEEFSLKPQQWCFPIAGCVPYRGYFKEQKARRFARKLRHKGKDVVVSPSPAYSTLGWFKDPLLNTMLNGPDVQLADYLFHELAHQRLYVKGDGRFNESYASFVARAGVSAWLKSLQRLDDVRQWQHRPRAAKALNSLLSTVRAQLQAVYRSDATVSVKRQKKSAIFLSLARAGKQSGNAQGGGRNYFSSWFEPPLNNAKLALFNTYEGQQCVFEQLFRQVGENMREFHRRAEQLAKQGKSAREKWLNQICTSDPAPGNGTIGALTPSKPGADS